jgi:lipopolysaccharide export system protein LptA
MNKNLFFALAVVCAGLSLAAGSRVITVTAQNRSGNLRTGPFEYTGNVKGKVQNLEIASQKATLAAPQGTEMAEAEGKRIATFEGGVTVTRGRLTATGPSLEYKETTGLGVLKGPTRVVQKPEDANDDDVIITSQESTFDVDTDVSTSRGSVKLVNGKQSADADRTTFDEKQDLACLTDTSKVTLVREPKKAGENKLTITARESRMLTEKKLLVATGGVTLLSGGNKTTGEALYYDDNTSIAYVVGKDANNPAVNVNEKTGSTIKGGTIERNINRNQVKQLGQNFKIPFDQFKCPSDK